MNLLSRKTNTSIASDNSKVKRPFLKRPAFVLILLAPVIAELLAGSTPLANPGVTFFLLVVYLPLYGAGVLLIRELVVRTHGGWKSILLLGAAYGLMEEGFASQSLFNPKLYHAAEFGMRMLGVNGIFSMYVIIVHIIWTGLIPLLLIDLIFPGMRGKPYLKRRGLITASIFYAIGVALLWFVARQFFSEGYKSPVLLPYLAVFVAVVLSLIAVRVVPKVASRPKQNTFAVPKPFKVALIVGVGAFLMQIIQFLWFLQPLFAKWPLILLPLLGTFAIAGYIAHLAIGWSRSVNWSKTHLVALITGAIAAHIVIGIVAVAQSLPDRIALAIAGLFAIWMLKRFADRLNNVSLAK